MIKIVNLVKNYKNNNVLNIKGFRFLKGHSYLLIGQNGSGKSTLIKCILGINKVTSGTIEVNTKNIGYVPEKIYFPEFCTIEKFLKSILQLFKIKDYSRIDYYCKLFKINKKLLLSRLSKGMMQKVLIIQALIHDANLYIFDEPLNGLDKAMQEVFFKEINHLRTSNNTVIITTHYPIFYKNNYDYKLTLMEGKLYESN